MLEARAIEMYYEHKGWKKIGFDAYKCINWEVFIAAGRKRELILFSFFP